MELFVGLCLGGAVLFLWLWRSAFPTDDTQPDVLRRRNLPSTVEDSPKRATCPDVVPSHRSASTTAYATTTTEINEDFDRALTSINSARCHVFVTGRAGTGKSTLLRHLAETTTRQLAIVAPTALAGINVGGQTIHSFFRLPPRFIDLDEIKPHRNASVLRALELLIIDEISMVRADLLDGIDRSLRVNRRNSRPFGGVQVVMFGDLWQLPPVVREAELSEYIDHNYGGPFFFHAFAWRQAPGESVELRQVYRQKDDADFLRVLQAIRESVDLPETLRALNARVTDRRSLQNADSYIVLTGTNDAAFQLNIERLNAISGAERTYQCKVTGKFDERAFPTDPDLTLKVGAKVIFVKNDQQRRWVNGSSGFVSALGESHVMIRIGDAEYRVEPAIWENSAYSYDRSENRISRDVVGSFSQLPVRLGWAITIHKSQGQTFEKVFIDLGSGAFAHGQTYVALSRCRTLAGVALARPIREKDVIVDPRVNDFRRVFPSI